MESLFFHGYANENYYDNNVNGCFVCISAHTDNDTVWPNLPGFHSEGKFTPLPECSTRDNTVGLLRLKIMRRWERAIYKD